MGAKSVGIWDYDSAQQDALQSCLDKLNSDAFRGHVETIVIQSFESRLAQYMNAFANFRSMDQSDTDESRIARNINKEVREVQSRLSAWFAEFLSQHITRGDSWLIQPPMDLSKALNEKITEREDSSEGED